MTIENYVTHLCQHCGVDSDQLTVQVEEKDSEVLVTIDVSPEDSGLLIGFHGETLNAIQRLCRIVFQEEIQDRRLVVNINQYREQRTEKLREMTIKAAHRVLETGQPYTFSYLPSNERFIVHSTLSEEPEFSELESTSSGEGFERVLSIRFKNAS